MALTITNLFFLNTLSRPPRPKNCQSHPFSKAPPFLENRTKTRIQCTNDRISDADLASDLAAEVAKMNTYHVQREAAMKKSRELLFTELCSYLDLETEEVMKKWSEMEKEEKWVLVKEFVNEWGANFHPLSARSVQEMIEEYVHEGKKTTTTSNDSSGSVMLPGLKRIMGIS